MSGLQFNIRCGAITSGNHQKGTILGTSDISAIDLLLQFTLALENCSRFGNVDGHTEVLKHIKQKPWESYFHPPVHEMSAEIVSIDGE